MFSTTTQPTLAEVEQWLTAGYRLINMILLEYGYEQDQTDTDIKGVLQEYNVWYACSQAEYSQASAGFSAESGNRGDMFSELFWGSGKSARAQSHPGIRSIINSKAFALLGATIDTEVTAYLSAGGISRAEKRDAEADSDLVPYMFPRDKFSSPHTRTSTAYAGDGRADL